MDEIIRKKEEKNESFYFSYQKLNQNNVLEELIAAFQQQL